VARPAPAASKAIEILNFCAAHPTDSFTLSELGRHLDLNAATAHAILAVLTDSGYLVRHASHKTYALGPAVVALGLAGLERHPVIEVARDEMRRLNAELGVQLVATTVTPTELLFVDRAGRYTGHDPSPRVGERVPLVPPLGSVFLAWAPRAVIDAWLDRLPPGTSDDERELYELSLDFVRRHGYAAGFELATRRELGQALVALTDHPRSADLRASIEALVGRLRNEAYPMTDSTIAQGHHGVSDDGRRSVSYIAAPVFGSTGEVVLALSAIGFTTALSGDEIELVAARMRTATAAITAETHGRAPA
jgi:DNA-binding IclR family transcriptional regulator